MPAFDSDGVEIAYTISGDGAPILLIHGFASSTWMNWAFTGWTETLESAGRMVICIDNRGHGESEKLYDPGQYSSPIMADDAARLLEHLGIAQADIMGYSMGARISAFLAINHPERVRSAVFAGLAENMITGLGGAETIARALEAPSLKDIRDPGPREFRLFAEATGSDLKALAACMRSTRQKISVEELGEIAAPVLIAVGTADDIAGRPEPLADAIPGSKILNIPGRDHMRTVGDKVYKEGVLAFLEEVEKG